MFSIGMRAHDLGSHSLETLCDVLASRNIQAVQLALKKALSSPAYRPGALNPGFAGAVRRALDARGIRIAVLGAYVNLIHPDPKQRAAELAVFEEHLRFAAEFGAPLVGTETGHRSADGSPDNETQSPQAFEDLIASVRRLCAFAESCGTMVGIEPVAEKHPLSSIERTARLLELVGSPALQIIFDPVNLVPDAGVPDQKDFFESAFQAFGHRIACIHAKDFVIRNGKKIGTLPAGTGDLDYDSLMAMVQDRKPGIHVLLENTDPETFEDARTFLLKYLRASG